MTIRSVLELGRYYPEKWARGGLIASFAVSLVLRTVPVLSGPDYYWLYYLPFWMSIEILLIWLFAIYGWIGVLVVDSRECSY